VDLLYEEYEAIKLADYDLMNHQEASQLMGVSRATFARVYESARRKIANALVETREIRSVFGNADLDESWRICRNCHARFNIPPTMNTLQCPMCKSENTTNIKEQA
jgi:predicted Zn-ribbon and HTH transcriptional regulator